MVPPDLRQRMSPDGPTPRKGMKRRMGRAILSIIKGVWGDYASKLAAWKAEVGLTPPVEEQKLQKRERAKSKKVRENRERVQTVCMGALCVAARGRNRPSRRVLHLAERRCGVSEE